jgi:uncharacterized membrane protein
MDPQTLLPIAAASFVGSHFLMSHPLRAPMVKALGDKGFMGVYTLISLATLGFTGHLFGKVGPGGTMLWNGTGEIPWAIASALALLGITLLIGSLHGNPALPETPTAKIAATRAHGAFTVTRHPMMWGIALWATAHILVAPTPRVLTLMGAMVILALVGSALQDAKKAKLLGAAWASWTQQTNYWPRLGALGKISPITWGIGLVVWLGATYGHVHANHVLAGVWRWIL